MLLQLLLHPHLSTSDRPAPTVRVKFNEQIIFDGTIINQLNIVQQIIGNGDLVVEHYGKRPSDTIVDNANNIISDKAIEIISVSIDDYDIAMPFLFNQKYYVEWSEPNNNPNWINKTLYLGYNGQYILPIIGNSQQFYYHILWEEERRLNTEEEKHVIHNGQIVETFTKFGITTAVDDNSIPTIDELYDMVSKN